MSSSWGVEVTASESELGPGLLDWTVCARLCQHPYQSPSTAFLMQTSALTGWTEATALLQVGC